MGVIYKLTSPSGKSYYGKTKHTLDYRWNQHVKKSLNYTSKCHALSSAIRYYGYERFTTEVVLICNDELLNYYETKFIQLYNTLAPNGYNLTIGGDGVIMTDEIRGKLSNLHRLRNNWLLPMGIHEVDFIDKNFGNVRRMGFNVRLSQFGPKTYTFSFTAKSELSEDEINNQLTDKYIAAIECYDKQMNGEVYDRCVNNMKSDMVLPKYVSIMKDTGFIVKIPGFTSKFNKTKLSRRQNLINALEYYLFNTDDDELCEKWGDVYIKYLNEEKVQRLNGNGA